MDDKVQILVVDDHTEIRELVARFLDMHGYGVHLAADGTEMAAVLATERVDLVVLDVMMPGDDGLTLCRVLRAQSAVPVIMLTALGEETDRIVGLETGADDYLAKPFNPRELLARIRAVLRRTRGAGEPPQPQPEPDTVVRFAGWQFDPERRELKRADGVAVPLSRGEHLLLHAFVQHPNRVLSRDRLLDLARGRATDVFDRSIDTQVSRLRRKIEPDPANPSLIRTVWGDGYMFVPVPADKV